MPLSMTAPLKGESLKIILIILLGWTAFAFADAYTKHLAFTYNPSLIAAIGSTVNVVILLCVILKLYGLQGLKWHNPLLCLIRLISSGFISFGIVQALSRIPIADMYGITFSSPFIGVVLAYFLLKEQVGWHRWLAVIIGFIGVTIVVSPQFEQINNGILFAIFATFFMGINNTIIRKIGREENTLNLSMLAFVGMSLVNLYFSKDDLHLLTVESVALFTTNGFLILAGVCLTTYGIAQAKSAASVAPFLYIQAIWGVIFGYIFFENIPSKPTFIGLMIVASAGLYMIYRERELRREH